jgi:hypothetical protein
MPITDEEYEDAYLEALRCLADDGHVVSTPLRDASGTRYCMVDCRKLDDRAVVEAWWEEDVARVILEGRGGYGSMIP